MTMLDPCPRCGCEGVYYTAGKFVVPVCVYYNDKDYDGCLEEDIKTWLKSGKFEYYPVIM